MDFIKETDLPGIGKKFSVAAKDGGHIIIIVHDDGVREIYRYDETQDSEVEHIISLDDHEARKIAGILGGMTYVPKALESMKVDLKELTLDWHRLGECQLTCKKSIGELGVRQTTGVSIIAIIKAQGENIVNPGPEVVLYPGDTIVLAGTREQIRNFHTLIQNEDN